MHELSIALSVLDLVEEEAARRGNAVVRAVHVKLGALSGVVKSALAFAYELAREQTALANCELLIEELPVQVYCRFCDMRSPAPSIQNLCCPRCGASEVEITGGRELEIAALEIEA